VAQHRLQKPEPWMERGACLDAKLILFFPPESKPTIRNYYRKAKLVCAGCEVRKECLEYGIREDYGVWGGTTPLERKTLRRGEKTNPAPKPMKRKRQPA
jgi:WhiB family redox-sensing transcriptional regulator